MKPLAKQIGEILACSGDHYHELLRSAAHLARKEIRLRTLSEISSSLASLGHRTLNYHGGGDSEFTEFEIASKLNVRGVNCSHDLTLQIHSWGESPQHESMRSGAVYRANFAIVSNVESPLSDLLTKPPYEFDTVGCRMLRSDMLRNENSEWPILNKIGIFYEYYANHHRDSNPFVFQGEFDFSSHAKDPIAKKHFCLRVESGLDPWCSHNGEWHEYTNPDKLGVVGFVGSRQTGKWPTNAG